MNSRVNRIFPTTRILLATISVLAISIPGIPAITDSYAASPHGEGTVAVRVRDAASGAPRHATIIGSGPVRWAVQTDAMGYSVSRVPAGRYLLRAEARGYAPQVRTETVEAGKETRVMFNLKPQNEPPATNSPGPRAPTVSANPPQAPTKPGDLPVGGDQASPGSPTGPPVTFGLPGGGGGGGGSAAGGGSQPPETSSPNSTGAPSAPYAPSPSPSPAPGSGGTLPPTPTPPPSSTTVPPPGFYAAPNGTPAGDGSFSNPWNLATALSQPTAVQPGATVWLRGGTYRGAFVSRLSGTQAASITVRSYSSEWAVLDGNGASTPALTVNGAWTAYRDFEVMNSSPDRVNPRPTGIDVFGPHTRLIHLIVHDTGTAIGFWTSAVDAELYGNVIYNNGWQGPDPDRGHGHGIYAQNSTGVKLIRDNIIFNQFGWGIHAYTERGSITGFQIEGNVSFNNGALDRDHNHANILVGGLVPADRITVTGNFTYHPSRTGEDRNVEFGYGDVDSGSLAVTQNWFVGGDYRVLKVKRFTQVTLTGNTLVGGRGEGVKLDPPLLLSTPLPFPTLAYTWDSNSYSAGSSLPFNFDGTGMTFATWMSTTRLDSASTYAATPPTGANIFVRPSVYDPGRATIVVFDWSMAPFVDVDVSAVLTSGQSFEVRNAQDPLAAPILTGTFAGTPLHLPLQGLSVATPIGVPAPASTAPAFAAFILLAR